jgi:CheY-like chemotaxis protein
MTAEIPAALFAPIDDPWSQAMAEALPPGSLFIPCPGDLPDRWLDAAPHARTIIRHRAFVSNTDLDRVVRARRSGWTARLVLCVGSSARYGLLQRWSGIADAILPESTAIETLPRHLDPHDVPPLPDAAGAPVAILSALTEMRTLLTDALRSGGYTPVIQAPGPVPDPASVGRRLPLVWDVPVLDPAWPDRLRLLATSNRPILALLGLADRELVHQARDAGANACLDLPCDPGDLLHVLARLLILQAPLHDNPPTS